MRFVYDAPTAKIIVTPNTDAGVAQKLVKNTGNGFATGSMSEAVQEEFTEFEKMKTSEQFAELKHGLTGCTAKI